MGSVELNSQRWKGKKAHTFVSWLEREGRKSALQWRDGLPVLGEKRRAREGIVRGAERARTGMDTSKDGFICKRWMVGVKQQAKTRTSQSTEGRTRSAQPPWIADCGLTGEALLLLLL